MAERIEVPSRSEERIEVVAGRSPRRRRVLRIVVPLVVVLALAALIAVGGLWLMRGFFSDDSVEALGSLVDEPEGATLVAVLAAPGDELAAAGALRQLQDAGVRTRAVYLGRAALPEATAPRDGRAERSEPGDARVARDLSVIDDPPDASALARRSAEILGIDDVTFLADDADSLSVRSAAAQVRLILDEAGGAKLVGFDPDVARDGRSEHQFAGRVLRRALVEHTEGGEWDADVWFMALPQQQVELGMDTSRSFALTFPAHGRALPPTGALDVASYASVRSQVADLYSRQWVTDTLPGYGSFPGPLQRVFFATSVREYYAAPDAGWFRTDGAW